ncbi:MAG: 16S rRNA (cytosine(967)-C(5))-methyltransferase RsmB [Oscillospiraceae bacterium]|nr:16S rRNA (cytosine(967)-C(5))-methyltransferase RsmB [Oscillospiraceae bacterium]
MGNARATAVKLLMRMSAEQSYSNFALDQELERSELPAQEKAFCTQLFYGVVERKITLEYLTKVYSQKNPEKLDAPVRYILYLGFYQMKYCDKIPDRAAIHESVKLAGYFRKKSASGFINAVLRKFQRAEKEVPSSGDPRKDMQIRYSVPRELLEKILEEHGITFTECFLENSLLPPPCTIRKNSLLETTPEQLQSFQELQPELININNNLLKNAFRIHAQDLRHTAAFQDGLFHVQGLSSQLCCQVLDAKPGEIIFDMCAAPGGKTFTIAQYMQNHGKIYAFDLHPHRVKLIRDGAERLKLTCVHTDVKNATEYNHDLPMADRILCDVPCSGFGVIRRRPEIKYKSLESVRELPELQLKILENSSRYLKPGGILVYSTCTILEQENQNVIRKFLASHPDFELLPLEKLGISDGCAVLSAQYADCEGFFIAKLHKKA